MCNLYLYYTANYIIKFNAVLFEIDLKNAAVSSEAISILSQNLQRGSVIHSLYYCNKKIL
jgi:hypothetical protein